MGREMQLCRVGSWDRCGAKAVLFRTDPPDAFEGGAEGEGVAVADQLCDRADGGVRFPQKVGSQGESPAGEEGHGRLADELRAQGHSADVIMRALAQKPPLSDGAVAVTMPLR